MNMRFPSTPWAAPRPAQRGAGSLIVVLVLFFVMALVVAYSSRNMIFEQKTSANQYRSSQALEAAEAGVEWALGRLNAGRIDDSCVPTAAATSGSFRTRYITIDAASGLVAPTLTGTPQAAFTPVCVRAGAGWTCSCPASGAPTFDPSIDTSSGPAFKLTMIGGTVSGVAQIQSQACSRLSTCLAATTATIPQGESVARLTVVVALKGAIGAAPPAALTAGGTVDVGGSAMQLVNTEPRVNGVTIDARGAVNSAGLVIATVPGAPPSASVVANDNDATTGLPAPPAPPATVPTPDDATAYRLFQTVFGMKPYAYQQQPAAIVLDCVAVVAQCDTAALIALAAKNPGRVLWIEGDLALGAGAGQSIGTAAAPVVMIVHGNLTTTSPTPPTLFGLLYTYNTAESWVTAGSPAVRGAVVAEGAVQGAGTPVITYDLTVLNALRLQSGSFVRVPGGWRDF